MADDLDPSLSSYYVGDAFYETLIESFADWQGDDRESLDPALRETCRVVLEREARLLDSWRLRDWLAMYAPECLYWVPATEGGGDPRREVAVAFDDRRRLEDRIFRLETGNAWSQRPRSRTARAVSGPEVFTTGDEAVVMVRSTFVTVEHQAGETRLWAGWNGHRLRWNGTDWEILVKQVNLLDYDRNLRNPSIVI